MSNKKSLRFDAAVQKAASQRGMIFSLLIVGALLAFELFNYSTTDFALNDLLGELRFVGIRWSTILALAFCGIDFAGIARLFTPEQGHDEPMEVWYLFGAWLIAATMNAILTWWGVSIAIVHHNSLGTSVIERATLIQLVPIFVASMVWLSRVLIIGTFSVAGERLFSFDNVSYNQTSYANTPRRNATRRPVTNNSKNRTTGNRRPTSNRPAYAQSYRPAPKSQAYNNRPDPTYEPTYEGSYQSMPMVAKKHNNTNSRYS